MFIFWDGITRAEMLHEDYAAIRHALANAAKGYKWSRVFEILAVHGELVNSTRPDGSSLFVPLHQAAYGGAPTEVVQRLIGMGAWTTLKNARGERPVDLAARRGHTHLLEILKPGSQNSVPLDILLKIQMNLHTLIRARFGLLIQRYATRLPELEPLEEGFHHRPTMWFPVPGIDAGFLLRFQAPGLDAQLGSWSWIRSIERSGQEHLITPDGIILEREGFTESDHAKSYDPLYFWDQKISGLGKNPNA